jgi:hypothetical protein
VPPPRCPECGRFLKSTMVELLTSTPTPCPRCGTGLVATMFPEHHTVEGDDGAAASVRPPDLHASTRPSAPPAGAPAVVDDVRGDGSIRPPDLVPVMVRDEPRDVLAGWDEGLDASDPDRWREDRAPFPTDAVVVLGAGAVGALLGALVGPRRARNAALGGVGGVVVAAVARQLWRLEP